MEEATTNIHRLQCLSENVPSLRGSDSCHQIASDKYCTSRPIYLHHILSPTEEHLILHYLFISILHCNVPLVAKMSFAQSREPYKEEI